MARPPAAKKKRASPKLLKPYELYKGLSGRHKHFKKLFAGLAAEGNASLRVVNVEVNSIFEDLLRVPLDDKEEAIRAAGTLRKRLERRLEQVAVCIKRRNMFTAADAAEHIKVYLLLLYIYLDMGYMRPGVVPGRKLPAALADKAMEKYGVRAMAPLLRELLKKQKIAGTTNPDTVVKHIMACLYYCFQYRLPKNQRIWLKPTAACVAWQWLRHVPDDKRPGAFKAGMRPSRRAGGWGEGALPPHFSDEELNKMLKFMDSCEPEFFSEKQMQTIKLVMLGPNHPANKKGKQVEVEGEQWEGEQWEGEQWEGEEWEGEQWDEEQWDGEWEGEWGGGEAEEDGAAAGHNSGESSDQGSASGDEDQQLPPPTGPRAPQQAWVGLDGFIEVYADHFDLSKAKEDKVEKAKVYICSLLTAHLFFMLAITNPPESLTVKQVFDTYKPTLKAALKQFEQELSQDQFKAVKRHVKRCKKAIEEFLQQKSLRVPVASSNNRIHLPEWGLPVPEQEGSREVQEDQEVGAADFKKLLKEYRKEQRERSRQAQPQDQDQEVQQD